MIGLKKTFFFIFCSSHMIFADIPLYWWKPYKGTNFGDELSVAIVERMIKKKVKRAGISEHKLLAIGSIIQLSQTADVIWGSGMNGNDLHRKSFPFQHLDVRAVRGPLTQKFLKKLGIKAPSIYGDPALLLPYLFPEFKVHRPAKFKYIVIPHISEMHLFEGKDNIVLPTAPWQEIVKKILQSKLVISSSLHGIIVAEAFGIPARFLRVTQNEAEFKYLDYYLGTGRKQVNSAKSIKEALKMGGEKPPIYDADALMQAFPFDLFK